MAGTDLTAVLREAQSGDQRACDVLLETVYDELRSLADSKLKREREGHMLQATALVHEAYLRLVDQTRVDWRGRTHFYAVASQAMGRVLIDHARGEKRKKRGGSWRRVSLDDAFALTDQRYLDPSALHDALQRMSRLDERQARVVELRLLGGMSTEDTARMLDISTRTVERDWKMGKAWLRRELATGDEA